MEDGIGTGADRRPMAGGRPPRVSDDEIVAAVERALSASEAPVVFTAEVADETSLGTRGLSSRLNELADAGRIKRKRSPGGKTSVWWL
jgi:hypothetical protein